MPKLLRFAPIVVTLLASVVASVQAQDVAADMKGLIQKANDGDSLAQFRLASAYDSGHGVPRDGKEAMRWYLASAEQGFVEAQNSVGSGLQAEKRYAEARGWYEKAASQKHAMATNNLAYLHDLGLGVQQDRFKAYSLYQKAAELGHAEAMWNLTNMVGAGQLGKPPDLPAACIWAARAQRYANATEQRLHAQLARVMPEFQKRLTSEQWNTCRAEALSWTPPEIANRSDLPN